MPALILKGWAFTSASHDLLRPGLGLEYKTARCLATSGQGLTAALPSFMEGCSQAQRVISWPRMAEIKGIAAIFAFASDSLLFG